MPDYNINSSVCFIGGDERQYYAALHLSQETELDIFVSGDTFQKAISHFTSTQITYVENPQKALLLSKNVILPLPAAKVEQTLPSLDLIDTLKGKGGVIVGGKFSPYIKELFSNANIKYIDYYEDECFTLKNAYITAEGAISIAMNSINIMLRDAKCAVLGFGRIGNALSQMLSSLGSKPYIFARRAESNTLAKEMGFNIKSDMSFKDFDVIFNTVPERIISNGELLAIPDKTVLIELASAPGGFDQDIAIQSGLQAINCSGLPGKYAPESAGKAVSDAVIQILTKNNIL